MSTFSLHLIIKTVFPDYSASLLVLSVIVVDLMAW